jgi:molybdenum cofactor guanylyltransferase
VTRAADWCGVLLAGGSATRHGGEAKGLLPFAGRRLADAALEALHSTCEAVVIAANDSAAERWFAPDRVVRDTGDVRGGLAALQTALSAAAPRHALVCAWDMPFVTADLLRALQHQVMEGAPAAVPTHPDGSREPLCAAYRSSLLADASRLLAAGERAAHALTAQLPDTAWPITAYLTPDTAQRVFFNVNTAHDLARATAWLSPPE